MMNMFPEKVGTHPQQKFASKYPEEADIYVCDKCEKDISAHLYVPRAHVRQPIGPTEYVCECGQRYKSGSAEWDHLNEWEKRQWLADVRLAFILFGGLSIFSVVLLYTVSHRKLVLMAILLATFASSIPLIPLVTAIFKVPFEIASSIYRTRIQ